MSTVIELGNEYVEVKDKEREYSNKAKEINTALKDFFISSNQDILQLDEKEITFTRQDRSSMNKGKLLEKLKQLNISEPIKTKEYVDEDILEEMIASNKIDPEDIADCVNQRTIEVIRIRNRRD